METNVQVDKQNSLTRFEKDKNIVFKQKEESDLQHINEPFGEGNTLKELIHSTHRYQKQEVLKVDNTNIWDFNPFETPQKIELEFDQSLSNCLETLNDSSTSERMELLNTDIINPFYLEQSKNF